MPNKFQVKRTSTPGNVPTTGQIDVGELAINLADGIAYSTNGSVVFELGANNTNVNISGNLVVKAISANGSLGSAAQVLHSNGSAVYWAADDTGGGGGVTTSDTAPGSPADGDLWWNSTDGNLYIYYDD